MASSRNKLRTGRRGEKLRSPYGFGDALKRRSSHTLDSTDQRVPKDAGSVEANHAGAGSRMRQSDRPPHQAAARMRAARRHRGPGKASRVVCRPLNARRPTKGC